MKRLLCCAAWLPALALVVGCAGLRGEDVIPPDVQLVNLVLQDATLFEQELRVDLRIINPNDFDLPLDGMTFDLRVNGDRVARGNSNESVTIPRLGDGVMKVTTHTSSVAIVRQMINPPRDGVYQYEIKGTVFLKGFGRRRVDFERAGDLPALDPTAPSPTI
jgi:LEA14-like dessication related protein